MSKVCGKCKLERSLEAFYKDKYRSDGLTFACKFCHREYYHVAPTWVKENRRNKDKRWREKHPEYSREHYLKNRKTPKDGPGSIKYEARLAGFRSGFERTIDTQLRASGLKYEYEKTKIPYTLQGTYTPDFYLVNKNIYVEVKGLLSTEDRRKMRAVKAQHPDLDIRFCFMDASAKIEKAKQTHGDWATTNGFLWCDKSIPAEWLDG